MTRRSLKQKLSTTWTLGGYFFPSTNDEWMNEGRFRSVMMVQHPWTQYSVFIMEIKDSSR